MSTPLRTDLDRTPDDPGVDRESRIEELLLSGLDAYFAGEYENAINIWTRVVFLERGHSRARAYIERARSALSERHRESEELLHRSVDAFDRGDTVEARDLINRAVAQVGASDLALAFLDRLNRLDVPAAAEGVRSQVLPTRVRPDVAMPASNRSRVIWLASGFALAALLGMIALMNGPLSRWLPTAPTSQTESASILKDDPLPIARSADIALARARMLYAGGHLRDALSVLGTIGIADPVRAEASALQADIQRRLLEGTIDHP